jgi:hypothetical protein
MHGNFASGSVITHSFTYGIEVLEITVFSIPPTMLRPDVFFEHVI